MRPDGRIVWVLDQAVLLRDEHGAPLHWQGVRFDMTDRKEAEQQLREAEERFRAIVEHVPSAIYLDAPTTSMQTIYISPQVEEITGISAEEWIEDPDAWRKSTDPEDRDRVIAAYLDAVTAGQPWSASTGCTPGTGGRSGCTTRPRSYATTTGRRCSCRA